MPNWIQGIRIGKDLSFGWWFDFPKKPSNFIHVFEALLYPISSIKLIKGNSCLRFWIWPCSQLGSSVWCLLSAARLSNNGFLSQKSPNPPKSLNLYFLTLHTIQKLAKVGPSCFFLLQLLVDQYGKKNMGNSTLKANRLVRFNGFDDSFLPKAQGFSFIFSLNSAFCVGNCGVANITKLEYLEKIEDKMTGENGVDMTCLHPWNLMKNDIHPPAMFG